MAKLDWTMEQKNEFFRQNENLVHKVAHQYKSMGYDYLDLFQMACVGFTKALNMYDDERGTKLTTYAVACMHKEILYITRKDRAKSRTGKVVVSYEGMNQDTDGDTMSGYDNKDLTGIDDLHMDMTPMEESVERHEL